MAGKLKKTQTAISIFPLLTKLIVVMLIVLGGILSFVIYQESKLDLQSTLNILEQEGSRLIYQIESYNEIQSFLERKDKEAETTLQEKLFKLLNEESHIFYIQIVNRSGEKVIHVGGTSMLGVAGDENVKFSLENDQEVTHTYKDPGSGNFIFEIIEPLEPSEGHFKGETSGALRLGLLLDKVRSQIQETRKIFFYNLSIFIIAILIIGIMAFYF